MEIRYKLTKRDQTTYNGFKWRKNKWYKTSGEGELCSKGWLHCYKSQLLAILHNPAHANIDNPRLWKCEVKGECKRSGDMKEGWTEMRLIEEMPVPEITIEQYVRYGILCAKEVYKDNAYTEWADAWLSGTDRSAEAARAAAGAARAAEAEGDIDLLAIAEKTIADNKK